MDEGGNHSRLFLFSRMRNFIYPLALMALIWSCRPKNTSEAPASQEKNDSTPSTVALDTIPEPTDSLSEEEAVDYAWYHIVIVDTSSRYDELMKELRTIEKNNGLEVDLMGRYFDKKKQAIILPEDDEDELYAGNYFPRRFPGNTLSIEYLDTYVPEQGDKTMALVATIATKRREADSLVRALKPDHPRTHSIRSKVFIGCLH